MVSLTRMICTKWTYLDLSDEIWRYQVNHTSLQAKMYIFLINQLEWKRYIFTLLPLSQDCMRSYIRSASELRRVRNLSAADNAIFSLTSLRHLHFKQTLSVRTEWHLLFGVLQIVSWVAKSLLPKSCRFQCMLQSSLFSC